MLVGRLDDRPAWTRRRRLRRRERLPGLRQPVIRRTSRFGWRWARGLAFADMDGDGRLDLPRRSKYPFEMPMVRSIASDFARW